MSSVNCYSAIENHSYVKYGYTNSREKNKSNKFL